MQRNYNCRILQRVKKETLNALGKRQLRKEEILFCFDSDYTIMSLNDCRKVQQLYTLNMGNAIKSKTQYKYQAIDRT